MFDVILSPAAAEFYAAADQPLNNVKRLAGDWAGYFRYRVGDWRVIYRIEDDQSLVYAAVIAHRREVYD